MTNEELAVRAKAGDETAKAAIIAKNEGLVWKCVKRYGKGAEGIEPDDLFSEGCLGLLRAIERFDPAKGCRFSTYATHWVRQGITRAIHEQSRLIRLPTHVSVRLRGTEEEELPEWAKPALSLDFPVHQQQGAVGQVDRLADFIPGGKDPGANYQSTEWEAKFESACTLMERLPSRDREALVKRFGFDGEGPRSFADLGAVWGVTRQRAQQLVIRALTRLRALIRERTDHERADGPDRDAGNLPRAGRGSNGGV